MPKAVKQNTSNVIYLDDYRQSRRPRSARRSEHEWQAEHDRMMRCFVDVAQAHLADSGALSDASRSAPAPLF